MRDSAMHVYETKRKPFLLTVWVYCDFPARFKPKSTKIEEKWCSHAEFAKYLLVFERFLSVVHNQIYLTTHRYSMSLRHGYYEN
jgi:hypothetical protein